MEFKKCPKCGIEMAYYQESKPDGRCYWRCNICDVEVDIDKDDANSTEIANMNWTQMLDEVKAASEETGEA